jgi:hypothetical protein
MKQLKKIAGSGALLTALCVMTLCVASCGSAEGGVTGGGSTGGDAVHERFVCVYLCGEQYGGGCGMVQR